MKSTIKIFFLLLSAQGFSQIVNIENKHIVEDTSGWAGAVDAGFSMFQNKALLISSSFKARIQYRTRNNYVLWINDIGYAGSNKTVFNNTGMSHLRYAHRIYKGLKWESFTQVQYNQILSQKLRALMGTGLRLKIIDTNFTKAFCGISTFIEYEELRKPNIYQTDLRASSYLSWFVSPHKRYSFSGTAYYQPLWRDFKDYRLMLQTSIAFPVLKKVDFKLDLNFQYDENPPVDVLNLIFSSSFGASFKF
jgi:Protein of unknown function, DUF481